MEFCRDFRPDYLYVDTWDEKEACKAMDAGFTVGLHPHAYMPVGNLNDALAILGKYPKEKYPRLGFVLDTAHLMVTYDNPVDAVRRTEGRIVAVHLKDWSPEFGRSSLRYARGFVELGNGRVDLLGVLERLRSIRYNGWVVAEQDYTLTDPDTDTFSSAKWLANAGILPEPGREDRRGGLRGSSGRQTCPRKREVLFSRQIARARLQEMNSWYDNIAIAFRKLIPCKLVEVWSTPPKQSVMSLVAIKPDTYHDKPRALASLDTLIKNRNDTLSGITLERKAITHFDLRKEENVARLEHPELARTLEVRKMVSLPIFNPWNFNHVRLIVSVFASDDNGIPNDDELFRSSANVSFAVDEALEDMCSACATKVNFEASGCKSTKEFLGSLIELVRTTTNCEGVAIFLVNETRDKLQLAADTGTVWTVDEDERFYRRGEGLTGGVWESGDTFITLAAGSEPSCKGKSHEGTESRERDDCLFLPLSKPTGEVVGVIRCRRKSAPRTVAGIHEVFMFSEDDASVLQSIAQAAVPHLEALRAREDLEEALDQMHLSLLVLGHETDQLNYGLEQLRRRHLCEEWRLRRLLEQGTARVSRHILGYFKQLDFLFAQARMLVEELPELEPSHFWSHKELLYKWADIYDQDARHRKLEFVIRTVQESDVERPRIYGDKTLLEQVVYNLVRNAVKYSHQGTRIHMDCKRRSQDKKAPHFLTVTDFGRPVDCQELYALRKRGANVEGIPGIGVGLYNAKRIAVAHGGTLKHTCTEVSRYNVPLIKPYLERDFSGKDTTLAASLQNECQRLEESGELEEITARNNWNRPLYVPVGGELVDLIEIPTWRVTFEVTIPAKGTRT